MSALLSLPDEVLKSILTHIPLKHRLGSCCLVHSRLHAAAVAATQRVQIGDSGGQPPSPQRAQSVLNWLSLHGQHVTRLEMWELSQPLTKLPAACTNLQDLRLSLPGRSQPPIPVNVDRPDVAEALSKLTRLELCKIWDAHIHGVVDSLSCLVHLKHLDIDAELSAATLPRLRHLTHLRNRSMSLENLRQLSALTALQALDCSAVRRVTASSVTDLVLPPSLTKLVLLDNRETGLEVALLPLAPPGLRVLRVYWFEQDGPSGSNWLFSSLAKLKCLTQLELQAYTINPLYWPPAGPVYSVLTARSSLVSLQVEGSLPAGVWPYVFRASHQLPRLTCLAFNEFRDVEWGLQLDAAWAFGAADLAALVSCCPNLCDIECMCLAPGLHVSQLRKLTDLTRLLACSGGDPVGTVEGLAAITQLRHLELFLGEPTYDAPLLPLTRLTELEFLRYAWSDDGDVAANDIETEDGSPPAVWLQLLERCLTEYPDCQPTALRGLAQQLAEQRALTARQQQQLSAQAQRIAGLQAQLSDQRRRNKVMRQQHVAALQQLAVHQEQLSAQQQVAAEQGGRIAALEGTLGQLLWQHMR